MTLSPVTTMSRFCFFFYESCKVAKTKVESNAAITEKKQQPPDAAPSSSAVAAVVYQKQPDFPPSSSVAVMTITTKNIPKQ